MQPVLRRTDFTGSALNRLLARLADGRLPGPRQEFADRLSDWVGWTDAIALAAALEVIPQTAAPTGAPAFGDEPLASLGEAETSSRDLREALVRSFTDPAEAGDAPARRQHSSPPDAPRDSDPADFSVYRRRYLEHQRTMETAVTATRSRLRATLAAGSGEMRRLAAVDAAMERLLAGHERELLGAIPGVLEQHFEHLRPGARGAAPGTARADIRLPEPTPEAPARAARSDLARGTGRTFLQRSADPAPGWIRTFHEDFHAVLAAELDLRMQPVEGLVQALRSPPPT